MADLIDDVIAELRSEFPEARRDRLLRFEVTLRERWGGERPYVNRGPAKAHIYKLTTAMDAGMTLDEAFSAAGISRQWGYRLLGRHRW